jgi:hypothetical protein
MCNNPKELPFSQQQDKNEKEGFKSELETKAEYEDATHLRDKDLDEEIDSSQTYKMRFDNDEWIILNELAQENNQNS